MSDEAADNQNKEDISNLQYILIFTSVIFLIGTIAALIYSKTLEGKMTSIAWILACSLSGIFIGFLFGIPKILQTNTAGTATTDGGDKGGNYSQQVNTNLTEISDWLTKIIVGLGLVNLTKIPPYLYGTASNLASGIALTPKSGINPALAFAYGLIVCFFITGFLFGYLSTRLYLAVVFSKVDRGVNQEDKKQIVANTEKIASLESTQALNTHLLYTNISNNNKPEEVGIDKTDKFAELNTKALDYLAITAPDWGNRVNLKNSAADQMVAYCVTNNITKDDIVNLYQAGQNEGLVIVLATMVNAQPETGDIDRLLNLSLLAVKSNHVKYRILMAISRLISLKLVKNSDKDKIVNLAENYKQNSTSTLDNKPDAILLLIKDYSV